MRYSGRIVSLTSWLWISSITITGASGGPLNQIRLGEHEDSDQLWRRVACMIKEDKDVLQRKVALEARFQRCSNRSLSADINPWGGAVIKEGGGGGGGVGNASLHLMCRGDDGMAIIAKAGPGIDSTLVYMVTRVNPGSIYYLSTANRTILSHLNPNSTYAILSFLLLRNSNETMETVQTNTLEIHTLPTGYVPGQVPVAFQSKARLNKINEVDVDINWQPVEELVCRYDVVVNSLNRSRGIMHRPFDVRDLSSAVPNRLSMKLYNLLFNTHYQVRVFAYNERDPVKEGPLLHFTFKTPTSTDFNLPEEKRDLLHDHYNKGHTHYPIIIEKGIWATGLIVAVVILVTIIIAAILERKRILRLYHRRGRVFQNTADDPIELQSFAADFRITLEDDTEMAMESLKIENVIGQGAFGLVRKAIIVSGDQQETVAVKMLKKSATPDDLRAFVHEIDVMKSVGKHPNIVGLVGHSQTQLRSNSACRSLGPMMILIEFCGKGNLLNLLREEWKRLSQDTPNGGIYSNAVENRCYGETETLTNRDLLSMACQIAQGMDHLSVNKVVHRDLAARNILVCEGNLVKISDFGLSRDVYQYNMYRKKGAGKLPIKWLAIESLTHQVYTSHSDVWSYGILLYEILTLGSEPYPSIATNDMVRLLNTGYRMERPTNCPAEIYAQMLHCWRTSPTERPNFKQMNERLAQIADGLSDEGAVIQLEKRREVDRATTYPSYMLPI